MFRGLEDEDDEDTELFKMTGVDTMNGKEKAAVSENRPDKQTILDEEHNSPDEDSNEETQQPSAMKKKKTSKRDVSEHSTSAASIGNVLGNCSCL